MKIEIKKNGFKKLQKRAVWLYDNEINRRDIFDGRVATLTFQGKFVAKAFINFNSKIAARVITFKDEEINKEFWQNRIKAAIKKREGIDSNSYRLIHSEADFLPGLIVDRYGDNLVIDITTAGIEKIKDLIVEILIEELNPKGIYQKGDKVRLKEGLEVVEKTLYGIVDEEFMIIENGKKFLTNLKESQKTGFFLDQRANRLKLSNLKVDRCLDLFANAGGFGIYSNAKYVKFVEISQLAVEQIHTNAKLNGLKNYDIVKEDVFKFLETEDEKYDLIIVDPPAFAKSKSAKSGALKGWKYLIVNSLKLLNKGGYIALFSCSHAINSKDLLDLALSSSIIDNSYLEVIEFLKQDIDHPYLINIPNSLYLTGILLRKN